MSKLKEKISGILKEGYSCSQTMYLLSVDYHQKYSDELLKALDGLSYGMHKQDTCGVFSGACCVMSLYLGTLKEDKRDPRLPELCKELNVWFAQNFETDNCKIILDKYDNKKASICPKMMEETFMKTMELLSENGVDIFA